MPTGGSGSDVVCQFFGREIVLFRSGAGERLSLMKIMNTMSFQFRGPSCSLPTSVGLDQSLGDGEAARAHVATANPSLGLLTALRNLHRPYRRRPYHRLPYRHRHLHHLHRNHPDRPASPVGITSAPSSRSALVLGSPFTDRWRRRLGQSEPEAEVEAGEAGRRRGRLTP